MDETEESDMVSFPVSKLPKMRDSKELPNVTHISGRLVRYRALDTYVLVVASATECVNDWSAYIGAVKGWKHEDEWINVWQHGSKLSKDIAKLLFPDFARRFKWRY